MFDRLKGFLKLLNALDGDTIKDIIAEFESVKAKDLNGIVDGAEELLRDFGYVDVATAVDGAQAYLATVRAQWTDILTKESGPKQYIDLANLVLSSGVSLVAVFDALEKAFNKPKVMLADATRPVSTWTRAEAVTYLRDHKADIRRGAKHPLVRGLFRRHPELLEALGGVGVSSSYAALLDPDRVERLIRIIEMALPILTIASAAFPYLAPVVIVLKLIVTFYRANHPLDGPTAMGLSLADVNDG